MLICQYFTPTPTVITDLAFLSQNVQTQKILKLSDSGRQNIFDKLMGSFTNRIGIGLLEFDILIINNYKLVFESKSAQPPLAYTDSILEIVSHGEIKEIEYKKENVIKTVKQNDLSNLFDSISIKTKESPLQQYNPNSIIEMSTVGNMIMVPQLDIFSKIYIGFALLLFVPAVFGWLKNFISYLILGPQKYFFSKI